MITLGEGEEMALDGVSTPALYLGVVAEDDQDVLSAVNALYCDKEGRPYTDVRIKRALIILDPFDDPDGTQELLTARGVMNENGSEGQRRCSSPDYDKPPEERVEERIAADEKLDEAGGMALAEKEEELEKKEAKSRAVVLEMLGDLPDADVAPPENVLFVCKLNQITNDEDLELIFSRFDPNAKADVIRDPDNGDSLCYAFVEFTTKEQCNEAYFKMNNVLIDDRRIKVDFSQSVAKEWNRYTQRKRAGGTGGDLHRGAQHENPSRPLRPSRDWTKDKGRLRRSRVHDSRWGASDSRRVPVPTLNDPRRVPEVGRESGGFNYKVTHNQQGGTTEGRIRDQVSESRRKHSRRYSSRSRSGSRDRGRRERDHRRPHESSLNRSSSPDRHRRSRSESSHDRHRRHKHSRESDRHHKHRQKHDRGHKESHRDRERHRRKRHSRRSHSRSHSGTAAAAIVAIESQARAEQLR